MNLLLTGFNDFVCELGAFHFRSAIHQAGEVIRYGFVVDGCFHAFVDQVSRFLPSEMLKQHNAGEDNGTRVYYVFVCIFRSRTMSRFENCMSCYIVDVSTRSDTDTPNLCSQRVRQVVPVQVQRRNDIKVGWTSQNLLQRDVGNRIFNDDFASFFSRF